MTREVFSARIMEMQDMLYRIAYGLLLNQADCADAVQECILRAWQKQAQLRDERYFRTWVVRILVNECHDIFRARKRTLALEHLPERAAPPGADASLHDAIAGLEPKYRLPLVLHYMEGYSVDEVAGLMRCPAGTIKTRLRKARALLRAELGEGEEAKR